MPPVKDLDYGGILALEVSVGALADGGRDLLHQLGALGKLHDFVALNKGEDQGHDRADEADPEQIFNLQFLSNSFCVSGHRPVQ